VVYLAQLSESRP